MNSKRGHLRDIFRIRASSLGCDVTVASPNGAVLNSELGSVAYHRTDRSVESQACEKASCDRSRRDTHCLDEDDPMESIDRMPRAADADSDVSGLAMEERVVQMGLEVVWRGRTCYALQRRTHEFAG